MLDRALMREAQEMVPAVVLQALRDAGFEPTWDAGGMWYFDHPAAGYRLCFGEDGTVLPQTFAEPVTLYEMNEGVGSDEWLVAEYGSLGALLAEFANGRRPVIGDLRVVVTEPREANLGEVEREHRDLGESWIDVRNTLLAEGHCYIGAGQRIRLDLTEPPPRYRAFEAVSMVPYGPVVTDPVAFFEGVAGGDEALAHLIETGACLLSNPETGAAFSIRRVEG